MSSTHRVMETRREPRWVPTIAARKSALGTKKNTVERNMKRQKILKAFETSYKSEKVEREKVTLCAGACTLLFPRTWCTTQLCARAVICTAKPTHRKSNSCKGYHRTSTMDRQFSCSLCIKSSLSKFTYSMVRSARSAIQ